jgi:hypothetical protein
MAQCYRQFEMLNSLANMSIMTRLLTLNENFEMILQI